MHSAFNLFVFPNYMFTSLLLLLFFIYLYFLWKGYELSGKIALKNNHYYYYYYYYSQVLSLSKILLFTLDIRIYASSVGQAVLLFVD